MRLALLLVVAVVAGCGRKGSGSGTARLPGIADASAENRGGSTGGTGGAPPAGGFDASGSSRLDAPVGGPGGRDAGEGDRAGPGDLPAVPPSDGPRPVLPDAGPGALPDAVAGPVDLGPPPRTAEFHQTLPLMGAVLTSRSPTFGWTDPGGVEYFVVEICRDSTCSDVIERGFSGLPAYTMQATLDEGRVFWRVRAMKPMGMGSLDSPVWYAHVPALSTMRDTSMLAFPDFNRDGFVDLAHAAEGGAVHVTSFGGLPPPPPVVLPGPARALAYAVDVNADGYGDLLIARAGGVEVHYGGVLGLRLVSVLTGGTGFGARVAGVGDVNGDGFGDVLVGSQPDAGAGTAALFLSSAAGLDRATQTLPLGRFGAAGDVNADGFADVVACSPAGARAALYVGSRQGLTLAGALTDPRTGVVSYGDDCRGVGDVNGDGFGDLVVTGANQNDQNLSVTLFMGAETGIPSARSTINATGKSIDDFYVASAGDVNRDGYTDVVLTSDAVRVYQGGAGGLTLVPSTVITGDFRAAAGLGDITRDLAHDLVVLPRACDQPARVYPGGYMGVATTPLYTLMMGAGAAGCAAAFLAR